MLKFTKYFLSFLVVELVLNAAPIRAESRFQQLTPQPILFDFKYESDASPGEKGQQHNIKDKMGKVVILHFWGTNCPPCVAEMPHLDHFQTRFSEEDVEVVAIANDSIPGRVTRFFKDMGIHSLKPYVGSQSKQFKIQAIPTTFIINRKGEVVAKILGAVNWGDTKIQSYIESYVTGDGPQSPFATKLANLFN